MTEDSLDVVEARPEPSEDDLDELGFAIDAIERRLADPTWNTADGRSVMVPRETVREVTHAAQRYAARQPAPALLEALDRLAESWDRRGNVVWSEAATELLAALSDAHPPGEPPDHETYRLLPPYPCHAGYIHRNRAGAVACGPAHFRASTDRPSSPETERHE